MATICSTAASGPVLAVLNLGWEGMGLDMCVWQVQMHAAVQPFILSHSRPQPKKRCYTEDADDEMFAMPTACKKNRLTPTLPLPTLGTTLQDDTNHHSSAEHANESIITPAQHDEIQPSPISSTPPVQTPEDVPQDVHELATYIKSLPVSRIKTNNGGGLPSRNNLKRDARLAGEVSRKTGCLMVEYRGGKLRRWNGDERLFTTRMWQYLTEEGYPPDDRS
ncbi:hypothetical protein LTR08_002732 [Meristemomyces frigidus]|nr:hypothetical protein LTR08_002732 [Meristemomyces frigidus]